jgi:hypothetical protein
MTGFSSVGNDTTFTVTSSTATTLVGTTTTQVNETHAGAAGSVQSGYVNNLSWAPIPDQFSDVFNNLFLSEAFAVVDDGRAQLYRQRGIAAFMAKATGLTETQKNAFAQQWIARDVERQSTTATTQLGNTARGM